MTDELLKDIIEYGIKGELTPKQFVELFKLIYDTRWENKVINDEDIKDKKVLIIWMSLKYLI